MSLAQRFERRLESVVGSAFARVFKGQVEPVEIATALQREATDKRNVMGTGEVLAPNRYRVTLSPSDYERLVPWEAQLTNSLAELVQEHLDQNGWRTIGDIEVYLARDDALHTGVFGVASRMESNAPPRRRPYDSLSLPALPGLPPGAYPPPPGQGGMPPMAAPVPGRGPGPGVPTPAMPPPGARAGMQPGPPLGAPNASPQPGGYRPPPGAAPRPASAAVVVDGTNRRFDLQLGRNLIGRGTDADLQLLDQGVRGAMRKSMGRQLRDRVRLGSTNGTSVNGHDVGAMSSARRRHPTRAHPLVFQQEHVNSPLALQLMRFGFLVLLWLFVLAAVRVVRSDLRSAGQQRVGLPPPARRRGHATPPAPAQAPRRGPSQLIVTAGGLAGTRIGLTGAPVLLGRANDSTLVLTDDYASTRHARISLQDGVWFVEDLGSTNGTYLGQRKVDSPMPLEIGVPVRIGKTVLELR
jgi:pSer/pThr/pTyr-binding forkhead associated (FHA) protein